MHLCVQRWFYKCTGTRARTDTCMRTSVCVRKRKHALCTYMHISMYVCAFVSTRVYKCIDIHHCMCECACVHVSVCAHIYMYACVNMCIYIYIHTRVRLQVPVYPCTCINSYIYIYMYACAYARMHVYVCQRCMRMQMYMHICIYAYILIYIYIYMKICMCVCINICICMCVCTRANIDVCIHPTQGRSPSTYAPACGCLLLSVAAFNIMVPSSPPMRSQMSACILGEIVHPKAQCSSGEVVLGRNSFRAKWFMIPHTYTYT